MQADFQHLVLHPHTHEQLLAFSARPPHALALVGARGSGKRTVAETLVATALGLSPDALASYPYFLELNQAEENVLIEHIRELQHFTQLKTVGSSPLRRAIIVLGAGRMTTEAQNALLKLLEEPPADTLIVLTIENERALLPTIMSRVQTLAVHTPPEANIRAHFTTNFQKEAVDKAYFLSGGRPGLMQALLDGDRGHPLAAAVEQAKDILQKSVFERLILADTLSKQKDEVPYVLQALRQIAETGLTQAAKQQDTAKIRRWHGIIKAVHEAEVALSRAANAKLALTNLMLSL